MAITAPSGLSVDTITRRIVVLSWTNGDATKETRLYWRKSGDTRWAYEGPADAGDETGKIQQDLDPGFTYEFAVSHLDASEESPLSATVTADVPVRVDTTDKLIQLGRESTLKDFSSEIVAEVVRVYA